MIKILTGTGIETDLTVELLPIHSGAMVTLVITDRADKQAIMVYDDEIDNLIQALLTLKGELK